MRCAWSDHNKRALLASQARSKQHYLREIWEAVWQNLGAMRDLEMLRVVLDTRRKGGESNSHLWDERELEIVKKVVKPKRMELVLHEELARRVREGLEKGSGNLVVVGVDTDGF